MTDDESKTSPGADTSREVVFHHIKEPYHLDLPVHGVFGGTNNANGRTFMAVFTERPPIPQEIHLAPLSGEGSKSVEETRTGKEGVIRSIGAVLHFDINTAIAIHEWLEGKIEGFKTAHPEAFLGETQESDKSDDSR